MEEINLYIDKKSSATIAISLGLLTPFLISIFISVSRYWTYHYGYDSIDYSIDTFLVMGLVESYFFVHHATTIGYSIQVFISGFIACCAQIIGTCLMIYASTKGLAGPSSAMVQVQGLIHTLLSVVFLKVYPSRMQQVGLLCAILGAFVMSVDLS